MAAQVVWFNRDLRIHDHAPLREAARQESVLPLELVEPGLWAEKDASGNPWAFCAESLLDLREQLAGLGPVQGALITQARLPPRSSTTVNRPIDPPMAHRHFHRPRHGRGAVRERGGRGRSATDAHAPPWEVVGCSGNGTAPLRFRPTP